MNSLLFTTDIDMDKPDVLTYVVDGDEHIVRIHLENKKIISTEIVKINIHNVKKTYHLSEKCKKWLEDMNMSYDAYLGKFEHYFVVKLTSSDDVLKFKLAWG